MKYLRFTGSGLGVLIALALLVGFGAWRYDGFIGAYNILTVLRYNSMFALVGLGMCFVIMTGGIDLSVGSVAAMSSVVSAYLSSLWACRRPGRWSVSGRSGGVPERLPHHQAQESFPSSRGALLPVDAGGVRNRSPAPPNNQSSFRVL